MPKGLCDSLGFSGVSTLSGADLERMMAERASGQTGLWRGLSSRLTRVRVRKEMPDGFSANVTFGGHYLGPVPYSRSTALRPSRTAQLPPRPKWERLREWAFRVSLMNARGSAGSTLESAC